MSNIEHECENENNVWRDAVRIGEFTYQYNCATGMRRVLKERDYDQGWVTVWRGGNAEDMPPEPKDLTNYDTD